MSHPEGRETKLMSQSSDSPKMSGGCTECYSCCEALSDVTTVVIVLSVLCYVWAVGAVTGRQERSYCGVRTEAEETAEYPAYNKNTQEMAALSRVKLALRIVYRIKK